MLVYEYMHTRVRMTRKSVRVQGRARLVFIRDRLFGGLTMPRDGLYMHECMPTDLPTREISSPLPGALMWLNITLNAYGFD
jgi:hypothetical protein